MPALTTSQLHRTHSQYLDASDITPQAFRFALNEIMPRIYKMGYWREMMIEHTQEASSGYVSLPPETDAIVSGILDNEPLPTRSLWHDYKIYGTNDQDTTTVNAFIDDGYAPTYRDLVDGREYSISIATLKVGANIPTDGTSENKVKVKYRRFSDATTGSAALTGTETVLESSSYNEAFALLNQGYPTGSFSPEHDDITEILSISWENLPKDHPIRIIATYKGEAGGSAATDSTKDLILADINTNRGVSRYRRFRVGNTNSDSMAHMLLKRRWVDCDSDSDLVHVPSNAILKHALLGKLSEDNADAQRAVYHWGVVKELLEADTDSYRGAAKPTLRIAPNGVGSGMIGMY